MKYLTTAPMLNLRQSPTLISTNIIVVLPELTVVEKIRVSEENNKWWYVKAHYNTDIIEGCLNSSFLKELDEEADYITTPEGLNLRKKPVIENNVITVIPRGNKVKKLSEYDGTWWEIRVKIGNKYHEGYVHRAYLELAEEEEIIVYERYRVDTEGLNFRKKPQVGNNIIKELKKGDIVEKIEETNLDWWKVQTQISGAMEKGYVAHAYLEKLDTLDPGNHILIPEVHLHSSAAVTRNNERWPFSLNENNMPFRNLSSNQAKRDSIKAIISWLNVERSNRYRPRSSSTYCNIYAYDFCYLNRVYIPRVWWTQGSIIKLLDGQNLIPAYGNTVYEINANTIYRWLKDYGESFGWERVWNLDDLQDAANKGKIGIICAPNRNPARSGHICAVVPETDTHRCTRYTNGKVRYPLQSQAGASNKQYFNNSNWWANQNTFVEFGFWIHD